MDTQRKHAPIRVGSLFAGYDGIGLGLDMLWPDLERAWFVEFDQAPSRILAHHWPDVPNYGDITAVDWATVEPVDILTGGFPCQDLSHAGKRLGLRPGTRSGLWEHMAYAIATLRPRLVVIENVRGLLSAEAHSDMERDCWCVGDEREPALRALGAVLGDLAELGHDARWGGVRAADAGAPHGRFRVFIVAYPHGAGWGECGGAVAVRPEHTAAQRSGSAAGLAPLLPTPTAGDGKASGSRNLEGSNAHAGVSLTDAVVVGDSTTGRLLLKTPTSQLAVNGGSQHPDKRKAGGHGPTLADEVEHLGFGPYAAAVARWEAVLARRAPSPTDPGNDGRPRLSPAFVEWMMGLPAGHVTDPAIGLTRAQALKALGNGVVPQQAALALRLLLSSPAGGVTRPDPARSAGVGASPLLPTPAVNDMGAGKSVQWWDEWASRQKSAAGKPAPHGKSLAIEALRLAGDHV